MREANKQQLLLGPLAACHAGVRQPARQGGSRISQLTELHAFRVQRPSDYAPNVALRFDYRQTGTANGAIVTPSVSVFFTDMSAPYPVGLPASSPTFGSAQINLIQSFNFDPTPLEAGFLSGQD